MDTNTEIALMKKDISNIDKNVTDLKNDFKEFIKSANKTYATKEEHLGNKTEIEKMKADRAKLVWIVVSAVILAVLASIGLK